MAQNLPGVFCSYRGIADPMRTRGADFRAFSALSAAPTNHRRSGNRATEESEVGLYPLCAVAKTTLATIPVRAAASHSRIQCFSPADYVDGAILASRLDSDGVSQFRFKLSQNLKVACVLMVPLLAFARPLAWWASGLATLRCGWLSDCLGYGGWVRSPMRAVGPSVLTGLWTMLSLASQPLGMVAGADTNLHSLDCLYIGSELVQGSHAMPRRRDEWTTPQIPISVEIDGVTHHGHYQREKGMIRVESEWGSKVTQLGGFAAAPASLARVILRELVRDAPKEG